MYDAIVIGGASAGLTAALYTSRQGLKTLLLTKDIGGQAILTDNIENYPGFDHIGGFELMTQFEKQARSFGTEILYEEVTGILEDEPSCFRVKTTSSEHSGCTIILAFGKTPRDLGVQGEAELKGKGVSYCAICDGPLFKGKKVAVVGAGDPALDAAVLLKSVASQVSVIHRTDKPIGSEETVQVLQNDSKVTFIPSSIVKRINGSGKLESLTLEDTNKKTESNLGVDGLFVEMGYVAKTDLVKEFVQLNANREIIIDREGATSHTGVFAAGDVTDTIYKQAVISAGQGCIAALSAYNYLQKLRGKPAARADWKSVAKKTS
jgi:thioredoxin reductase (NADPH)